MPDNRAEAAAYLRELQERREAYQQRAVGQLQTFFKRRDRRPPEEFHDSSFLYLRSYDADIGNRPFTGIDHWRSPDLLLSPASNVGAYTTQLNAGTTYIIRCLLRNRGDLAVPSAKVELYLTDPTLGFDTRFAKNLTLGKVPSAWVTSGGSAAAEFPFTVLPADAGHKCLFARTFSFSPLEMPIDDFALDPRLDRHVAQQNLNIVSQGDAYGFKLVHAPNARLRLDLKPMTPEALLALRHPVLADVQPARDFPQRGWVRLARVEAVRGEHQITVERLREGLSVQSADRQGLSLAQQRRLSNSLRKVLAAVEAGKTRMADHRELLASYRKMSAEARLSSFAMQIPDLGLRAGQAVGFQITSVDESSEPQEVIGGITLVIVG